MENSGKRDKLGITNTVFSLQLEISHFYVIFIKLLLDLQMFFCVCDIWTISGLKVKWHKLIRETQLFISVINKAGKKKFRSNLLCPGDPQLPSPASPDSCRPWAGRTLCELSLSELRPVDPGQAAQSTAECWPWFWGSSWLTKASSPSPGTCRWTSPAQSRLRRPSGGSAPGRWSCADVSPGC